MNTELELRDIHLPEPVGWWPLAPGWWILLAIFIACLLLTLFWMKQRKTRLALRRSAQHELQQIKQRYQQQADALLLTQELSILLRRVAMSISPRNKAAGLTGEAWLAFLDSLVDKPLFDSATGRQLISAPYQAAHTIDTQTLLDISEQWLKIASQHPQVSHA